MNRLPVPEGALAADLVELDAAAGHKVRSVLRLRAGDRLELFDGRGAWAEAVLDDVGEVVRARVVARHRESTRAPIHLAQGLAKGDKIETVIQKATELGAASVRPFRSARAVVKLEGEKAQERVERWRRIAMEAARQCGRADVPEIAEVADWTEILAAPGAKALLYEGEKEARLGAFLDANAAEPVTLIVGPEGGFAPEEVEQAKAAGVAVLTLGQRILRTETVALAALAVALHRRGELG